MIINGSDDDGLASLAARSRRRPPSVRWRVALGGAVLLLVAAIVAAIAVSLTAPSGTTQRVTAVTSTTRAPNVDDAASAPLSVAPTTSPSAEFVHVTGAVKKPGLYPLGSGSRVMDAVAAAGGFTDSANRAGVNLARRLRDGEQLVVPKKGEPVTRPNGSAAAPGGAPGRGGAAAGQGAAVDLNRASEQRLESLPGIGPTMAQRIIDWRTAHGGFDRIQDLMSVSGIGQKTFDGLKDQVTV